MGYVLTSSGVRRDIARPVQHQVEVFDAYDDVGKQTVSGTEITLNLTQRTNSNADVYTLSSDELTINRSGVADIGFRVTLGSFGTDDYRAKAWLERDTGSGYVKVAGSDVFLGKSD